MPDRIDFAPTRVIPIKTNCRDCGEEIYWARMENKDNKFWPVNVEEDLDKGRVVLRINSTTGKITGRWLEKGEPAPDGSNPRQAHFQTCSAKAGEREQRNRAWKNRRKEQPVSASIPTPREIDIPEPTGDLRFPEPIDPDKIPF